MQACYTITSLQEAIDLAGKWDIDVSGEARLYAEELLDKEIEERFDGEIPYTYVTYTRRRSFKMYLYHYFGKRTGPFKSLTAIPEEEAREVLREIKAERPNSLCAARDAAYIKKRRNCEAILRREFEAKGGIMEIDSPYYMVVEHSPWLSTWYEKPDFLKIPIEEFDVRKLSFTYGDSMPTFSPRVKDGKEYRRKVYTYQEILKVIEKYGLPQDWNDDGAYGPERYIEAHVWSDETIKKYL